MSARAGWGRGRVEAVRCSAGAAGQHGKTAAPPANAQPSPRVAGRTQPSIHAAGGEESPPAHGRTDVRPLHALHSSPLDTPACTRARRLDDGRSPPPRRAQRLRPTRTPPAQQQRAPRRPPTETLQCRAPRPHPARADTAHTPTHSARDRPTLGRRRAPARHRTAPRPRAWHTDAMLRTPNLDWNAEFRNAESRFSQLLYH